MVELRAPYIRQCCLVKDKYSGPTPDAQGGVKNRFAFRGGSHKRWKGKVDARVNVDQVQTRGSKEMYPPNSVGLRKQRGKDEVECGSMFVVTIESIDSA